jgi:hypothetical protein
VARPADRCNRIGPSRLTDANFAPYSRRLLRFFSFVAGEFSGILHRRIRNQSGCVVRPVVQVQHLAVVIGFANRGECDALPSSHLLVRGYRFVRSRNTASRPSLRSSGCEVRKRRRPRCGKKNGVISWKGPAPSGHRMILRSIDRFTSPTPALLLAPIH